MIKTYLSVAFLSMAVPSSRAVSYTHLEVAYQTGIARDEYAFWYQDSLLRDGRFYALVLLLAAAALAAGAVQFLRRRGLGRRGVAALAVLSGVALAVVAHSAHYNHALIRDCLLYTSRCV